MCNSKRGSCPGYYRTLLINNAEDIKNKTWIPSWSAFGLMLGQYGESVEIASTVPLNIRDFFNGWNSVHSPFKYKRFLEWLK